jgi:hypothetical protein
LYGWWLRLAAKVTLRREVNDVDFHKAEISIANLDLIWHFLPHSWVKRHDFNDSNAGVFPITNLNIQQYTRTQIIDPNSVHNFGTPEYVKRLSSV